MTQQKSPTLQISLDDIIFLSLGDLSSGIDRCPIPMNLALDLVSILNDSIQFKLTFQDFNGKDLKYPILWRYTDWMLSNERYKTAKDRAEKERVSRWIYSQNLKRLSNALAKEQKLDESYSTKLASNLLNKNTPWEVLHILGLNQPLITKEEELE